MDVHIYFALQEKYLSFGRKWFRIPEGGFIVVHHAAHRVDSSAGVSGSSRLMVQIFGGQT